jgi:hypothetical protein
MRADGFSEWNTRAQRGARIRQRDKERPEVMQHQMLQPMHEEFVLEEVVKPRM